MPGAFLIYKAYEEKRIVFANHDLVRLFGCSDYYDFLQFTDSSFCHVIYPDDLDRVEAEIGRMLDRMKENSEGRQSQNDDYMEYSYPER
jgi:hypothetical protein